MVDKVLRKINPDDSGYIFFASELEMDPVKNSMVPKHRIAAETEIES